MKYQRGLKAGVALAASTLAPAASAHIIGAQGAAFGTGFAHPFTGLDHMLAMVAVGLWAAQRGGRALWCVPLAFMSAMAVGAALALAGVRLPAVETGIASSVLVLGLLIAFAARFPVYVSMAVVGAFALFHGHAHGTELLQVASAGLYGLGLLLATGGLHAAGAGISVMFRRGSSATWVRMAGSGIATAGLALWVMA